MEQAVAVFDLDGTLVDSSADIHDALRVALRAVDDGREEGKDAEAIAAGGHGLSLEMFFWRARPAGTPEGLSAFIAAYRAYYDAHLLDRTRPFPGVVEGLERLQALRRRRPQLRLAVATTKLTATARRVVAGLDLGGYLDLVLGSDGLPCKPDPAVIHAVLEGVGHRRPPRGLMVGDTEHDIVAGRAAGLRTCSVAWSELPAARLQAATPDHHAGDFQEVVDLVIRMAGSE